MKDVFKARPHPGLLPLEKEKYEDMRGFAEQLCD